MLLICLPSWSISAISYPLLPPLFLPLFQLLYTRLCPIILPGSCNIVRYPLSALDLQRSSTLACPRTLSLAYFVGSDIQLSQIPVQRLANSWPITSAVGIKVSTSSEASGIVFQIIRAAFQCLLPRRGSFGQLKAGSQTSVRLGSPRFAT